MAYTLTIPIALEPTDTGLTLEAMLIDTAGADVGVAVTTGFVEVGNGLYAWTYAAFPDGHRGGVKFQLSGGGALQAFTAINPEEAENTDVKTSTRLATAGYAAPLDAAGTRTAVGLATANLDTQLDALPTAAENASQVRTELTTELGRVDVAVSSRLATAGYTAPDNATITAIAGFVDTEVAAIKAKTDLIPASPAAVGDIPTANANADALLDRANGVETGLTLRQALRLVAAAVAGELSGAATTTITIRNAVADSKDRLVATVTADGDRTAIVYDLT